MRRNPSLFIAFTYTMRLYLTLFMITLSIGGYSQPDLESEELKLNANLLKFRGTQTTDEMNSANTEFTALMREFLLRKGAFTYSFKHLKTVAVLDSPDQKIRIVNWNIEYPDMSYSYGAFVMVRKNKKVVLYELKDALDAYESKPTEVIGSENWYGALYYKIVPYEINRSTEYILIGWDGGTVSSNFKIIDVLSITKKGLQLGSPVFNTGDEITNRLIFEYSDKANMTVRFEEKYNRIVMDHLSPEAPSLEGLYSYYVPDFSYDAYWFDGEFWNLKEDVIAVNDDKNGSSVEYIQLNPRTGRLEKRKSKKGWIDPSSEHNKGDLKHVARTPEPAIEPPEQIEKRKKKKRRRRRKDDPAGLSVTTGKYKKNRKNKH